MYKDEFKRISTTKVVKVAWTILETVYEETLVVKASRLQMLTTRFEEIRMTKDESFDEFYAKLNDIVNSSSNLGETMEEFKVFRKILRSLPKRFSPKGYSHRRS